MTDQPTTQTEVEADFETVREIADLQFPRDTWPELYAALDSLQEAFRRLTSSERSTLHGDAPCSRCATQDNIIWFTDNVFWNAVIRTEPSKWAHHEPILCIPCFVECAEGMGYRPTSWRLSPQFRWEKV
jgi:hypothetical protein